MSFKSSRPTYAIIMLALSSLFMCAMFLPLLYSVVFPNEDIQRVVAALKERGTPPPEAVTVVQQAVDAVGTLTTAIQVGAYSAASTGFHLGGPSETIKQSQVTYLAWFQKRTAPMLVAITRYERNGDQRAYQISEGDPLRMVLGYAFPLSLFGVSLFLARKRRSNPS